MKQPFTPQKQILSCFGHRISKYCHIACIVLLMTGSYFAKAQTNNALNFDGSNDNANFGSLSISGNNARTVECWLKTSYTGGWQNIFSSGNSSNSQSFNIKILDSGTLGLMGYNNDYYPSTGAIVNDGKWHHIAVTYDGSTAKGYVDGTLDWIATMSLNTSGNENYLGRTNDYFSDQQYFNGVLDELHVWNVARTADEILDNLNVKPTAGQAGLVAYYDFDEGIASGNNTTITALMDKSGNGLDATLYDFALTGTVSNFVTSTFSTALIAPVITQIPSSFANCLGSTVYLNARAYGIAVKYQWYKDGSLLANETFSGLTLSNVSAPSAGNYTLVASNPYGSVTSSGVAFSISANCNNALDFDGNDDFVQLPEATYFTNNNFTVETWVYPKAYNNWSRIIDFSNGESTDNVLFAVTAGNSGKPNLGIVAGNGANWTFKSQLSLNTWSHVAVVVQGNKASMYINGVLDASFTDVYDVSNVTRTLNYIGRSAWSGDGYASMILDELKIWNVGLSGSDIVANLNKKPALNQPGLVVYYDFDQGVQSGDNTGINSLTDKSGNGYNGTLTGFALTGSASNFISGASLTSLTGAYAFLPLVTIPYNNINKTYGDPMFTVSGFASTSPAPFTYSILGTSMGINGSSSNSVTLNITGAGNSVLRISQTAVTSFAGSYTDVNIHVDQASLNATAYDFTKIYGLTDVFTGTVTGMVNEDVFALTYYLENGQVKPSITGLALGNYYVNYNYGTYFSTSLTSSIIDQIGAYNPTGIATGDLNADGFKDLAVTFQNSNNILVYTNTGTGSFNEAGRYTTGYRPQSVVIGDLNGDGFPDLAVANQYSEDEYNNDRLAGPTDHSVSVFTNTGTGSFGTKVDYAVGGSGPQSIAIGDVNGDGYLDLATANSNSNTVSVITNTGLGEFGDPVNYNVGSNPYNVAFGDLNGDSKLDLVVTNYSSNTISVLTNTGIGSFGVHVTYNTSTSPRGVAIGDLNGDTFPDLAVTNRNSSSVSVFTNTGTGSFGAQVAYATDSRPYSVEIGDFNGDGKPDLAVANYRSNTVSVLTNTGTGNFGSQITYNTGGSPFCIAMADLNGDNKPDLATTNYNSHSISIILNTGTDFSPKKDIYAYVSYDYLAISDLNGDNKQDLIVVNGDNDLVSVKMGLGNNTYAKDVRYETGDGPYFVVVGDLNGDGYPDLAISNNNEGTISVLTNTGSGSFGEQIKYNTGGNPYGVAIGDLNADGKPDLAVTNTDDNNISIFTNTGLGGFGSQIIYNTGSYPYNVIAGDLNGDGKPDLAITNYNDNTISVLTNTGIGNFGDQITYNTGSNPTGIAVGDLNSDGNPDLAIVNSDDNTVSVLTNTGANSFGVEMTYNVGSYPQNVAIGDFNGDGKPDLVVANSDDYSVSVLNNSGAGRFNEQTKFYLNDGAYNAAIGDLDSDGRLDIAGAAGDNVFTLLNSTLRAQTITGFDLPDSLTINASPLLFSAVATSGLPVTYASANNNIISVTGVSGSPVSIGVVTLTAYQVGGGYYLPTAAIAVVTVHDTLTQQPQPTVTGISLEESIASVVIYPNPSTGRFTVKGANNGVIVYDLIGNLVAKTESKTFYLATKGLYIAEVQTAVGKKFVKLVVE